MCKFTIIIPVYNKEKYISRCLESIKKQTCRNFEAIIIDDGSSDNSKKIISRYIDEDNRFKYIFQQNSGCSSARNKGIKEAKGEYLIFVDADDYISPTLLENADSILVHKSYDLIQFGYNENEEKRIPQKIIPSVWAKTFKTEIVKKYNIHFPLNTHMGEDLAFTLKYEAISENYYISNFCDYYYGVKKDSVMHISNINQRFEIFESLDDVVYFMGKHNKMIMDNNLASYFLVYTGINGIIDTIVIAPKNIKWKVLKFLEYRKKFKKISKLTKLRFYLLNYIVYTFNRKIFGNDFLKPLKNKGDYKANTMYN